MLRLTRDVSGSTLISRVEIRKAKSKSMCDETPREKSYLLHGKMCKYVCFACRNYGWTPFDPFGRRLFLMNFRQVLLATQAAEYIV